MKSSKYSYNCKVGMHEVWSNHTIPPGGVQKTSSKLDSSHKNGIGGIQSDISHHGCLAKMETFFEKTKANKAIPQPSNDAWMVNSPEACQLCLTKTLDEEH